MDDLDISVISDHTLFSVLSGTALESRPSKCLDLMAHSCDFLVVWNQSEECLNVINLKHALRDSDMSTYVSMKPFPSPLFDVEKVLLNEAGTLVALAGANGISVVVLPERWGDKKVMDVKAKPIGQRLFLGEQFQVVEVKWHPGSPSESHLLVLSSDETLRLFDALSSTLAWKCSIKSYTSRPLPMAKKISAGEAVVDFDIGAPLIGKDVFSVKWPILVLMNNGDVYCVVTTLNSEELSFSGPLRMYPQSDDNYGTDASSIILLKTSPSLVVLSTCNGTLYHCLLLPTNEAGYTPEWALHVIECVELGIGLPVGDPDDAISSSIRLLKNPGDHCTYFAIHNGGVHLVSLPLAMKLQEFLESNEPMFNPVNLQSSADYLLCTALSNGSSLPLMGLAFIECSMSALVLLNDLKLLALPIAPTLFSNVKYLSSGPKKDNEEIDNDGFLLLINNLVKSKELSSKPLVKLSTKDTQPQEWLEVIMKVTQDYKETLQVYENVALKIKSKVEALKKAVVNQQSEIKHLECEKAALKEKAEQLAEKYEDINEKQGVLTSRAEKLVLKMKYTEPHLTSAEKKMMDTLKNTSTKIEKLEKDVSRVRTTYEYQSNIIADTASSKEKKELYLSDSNSKLIRNQLHHLNQEISTLTKRVKDLKKITSQVEGF